MNTTIRIAVLLTCHNRRDKTINCLKTLYSQNLPDQVQLSVYLVDDGSTDGTSEAVHQFFPQVKILQGSGQLFWTGGMQLAFAESSKENPDFYFWLNDDTNLYLCAIQALLHTYRALEARGERKFIVVGSTQDSDTSVVTYGGCTRSKWLHPLRFSLSHPSNVPKQCATMNGNAVLIPQDVFALTGNLDTTFKHYMADYDYGLRARQQGCSIWIAPGYSGTCQTNIPESKRGNWNLPAQEQFKKLQEPKGLRAGDSILYSFEEWKLFSQRHGGFFWFIYWLLPYRRLINSPDTFLRIFAQALKPLISG
jgi:GT2 family glycosyltransferase